MLYFAVARDVTSVSEKKVYVEAGASLGALTNLVFRAHPALKRMEGSLRFSVNLEVAEAGARLREGDVVGVLPPVAGG